jgi:uncharacterized membrane protein YhaH (DUF805 family)
MFTLFNLIFAFAIGFVEGIFGMSSTLSGLYTLAVLLPSIAVGIRRLHDTGRSGWWLLLSLIPLVGAIILIIYLCEDSKENENQYGPNPKFDTSLSVEKNLGN